ncbi:MAG: enoyl-CoA hydratase/isomerase family protein [Solirubrobacterales bacterium]|nr:enoyl-CoA hydratase/isomerase family protein [Solirubrobacterales bacterium]
MDLADRVGTLVLNRPDKLNALSPQMLEELIAAAGWFDDRPEVKAVLVRGAGRAFTAGSDLSATGNTGPGNETLREGLDLGRRMIDAIADMRALTVAAIHGHCVGGGVVLASACDIRIAAEGTRFAIPEVDLGMPLTWGGVPRLVRELGPSLTKDLVLTCRSFDAEEAHRMGLVTRLVSPAELESEAGAVAEKLASQPAYALTTTKRHVDAVAEESASTLQTFREVELLLAALQDEECQAAMVRAFSGEG